MPERLFMMPSTSIPLSQSEICWSSASKGRYLLYDQPKSPDRSGTRVMPMRDADEGDTAAGHQLLHALGLRAGVIVAVTFQQVDSTPDAKTGTERHDESLQYTDCAVEKCHR